MHDLERDLHERERLASGYRLLFTLTMKFEFVMLLKYHICVGNVATINVFGYVFNITNYLWIPSLVAPRGNTSLYVDITVDNRFRKASQANKLHNGLKTCIFTCVVNWVALTSLVSSIEGCFMSHQLISIVVHWSILVNFHCDRVITTYLLSILTLLNKISCFVK